MLKQRVITAIVLLAVFYLFVFVLPQQLFAVFVALVAGLGAWEWARLSSLTDPGKRMQYGAAVGVFTLLLLFLPFGRQLESVSSFMALLFWMASLWLLFRNPVRTAVSSPALDKRLLLGGVLVLSSTAIALRGLHSGVEGASPWLLLYALAIVWVMDIGAYFSGRRFGKVKLAPLISPGKTREGVYGGLVCAVLLMVFAFIVSDVLREQPVKLLLATLLASVMSVAGDLYESRLKRAVGVKDSSQLLPGHGGVLDRIDGVVAAMPLFLFVWVWF